MKPTVLAPVRSGPSSVVTSFLASVLALAPMALAQDAPARLRVGTWNLEQLGFRSDPPRAADDPAKIAAFVLQLEVAVLAVQEIGGAGALRPVVDALGPDWDFVLGTSGGFSGEGGGQINVGFVYDQRRVELLGAEELAGLPRTAEQLAIFHRLPVTATFRARTGGFDFRLVTVHLKAGRKPEDARKRWHEVTALRDSLRALLAGTDEDQDVLVLGDFNHTYRTPEALAFGDGGLVRYLESERPQPTILHFAEPIDHVAATRGIEEELVATSRTVHDRLATADPDAWRAHYSDHVPVTVELVTAADRDPGARFTPAPGATRLLPGRRTAPKPVEASAPAAARGGLEPGVRVEVVLRQGGRFEGILLVPLGDWVHIDLGKGVRAAFARENVEAVFERR